MISKIESFIVFCAGIALIAVAFMCICLGYHILSIAS